MNFRSQSRIGVRADAMVIWNLIADLPMWSRWNPIEKNVSGTFSFGGAFSATESIPGLPERAFTGKVSSWTPGAQLVISEKRGFLFNSLRFFEIDELEPGSCIVANGQVFSGIRGEGFYEKHRRPLREAFDQVAESIKREAEARSS